MDIKARGNEFFRDGDFRGAANEFQRALENADQVKKHNFQVGSFETSKDLMCRQCRSRCFSKTSWVDVGNMVAVY